MFLLSAAIFASLASVLVFPFTDNIMSPSRSCSSTTGSSDHLDQWQIMRTTAPSEAAVQVEVFSCKKCPKVFSCQQAMAGHMKGHSTKIPKRRKKTHDHPNPPPAALHVFVSGTHLEMTGEISKRHDPQLDLKGKQVSAFGLNTNVTNPNRNLIIREPAVMVPMNPNFQAYPPPPAENFIPFGVPLPIERSLPLAYAGHLEETYSPPLFNNPDQVTTAYIPVISYPSNALVNPLGMHPIKRYVQPSFLQQTGYEEVDKDCSTTYAASSSMNINIDGAKGSASGGKKHLDLNLNISSGPPYNKKESTGDEDEDLDLELQL